MKQDDVREDWEKEFDNRFGKKQMYCKCCGNEECDHSTTGCPWYEERNWTINTDGYCNEQISTLSVKSFIRSLLSSHSTSLLQKMEGLRTYKFQEVGGLSNMEYVLKSDCIAMIKKEL